MASNGGDATPSPPTDTPNTEPTATKTEVKSAADSKPGEVAAAVEPPVKQVAEDLTVDQTPKEDKKSSSEATVPEAASTENKPEVNNSHEVTPSSAGDTKADKEPVAETTTNASGTDIKTSVAAKPEVESSSNGNGNQQPAPSAPPATQTTKASEANDTPMPATDAVNSKPDSKKETPPSKPGEPSSSDETKPEKMAEGTTEQKASSEETTKPVTSLPGLQFSNKTLAQEYKRKAAAAAPPVATVAPMPKVAAASNKNGGGRASSAGKHASESQPDGDAPPQKKTKTSTPASSASSKNSSGGSGASVTPAAGKTPQQILEYMNKTFEQRRRIITKQMPTIPELQKLYPDLFMHKQLLTEFQRITKIDIDQKIQEFCVRFATAVIEMARGKKGAAPVIARWEKAQEENQSLKQYWDMMTALCLLPLHFGENFADMVQEIGEDDEVVAQGKIVPILVARGNVYRTDEFYLIAENTIVQEFEEFTIALASLYSSYWVFNMVYPESIENTYNYIQRCIVRQKEPGSIPTVCRNFTKALQKWNREKEGK
ncbi:hypothetical protein ElyMa_004192500 [Elysia marginata]|uniref:Uncharacterized protein n=1 Tax=Elysia marginata TaxID=1093978 RepID=A0AAV4GP55_9GAST|nr:hypothetical protein ElyMa_004192500 [Elysia marginata]